MHVPGPSRSIHELAVISDTTWQMAYGERFALEGLLSQLQPALAIETGTAEGGTLRRIASHAEEVHCFDLVESVADVAAQVPNAYAHIGDSAVTLPAALAEFEREGRHVDFALIDGDHTYDGVQRDARAVLDSDACRRTVVVFHDTANDEVRAGLDELDLPNHPKVELCMLDFVPGYLVASGQPLAGQAWNGLGLVVLNDGAAAGTAVTDVEHYEVPALYSLARGALGVDQPRGTLDLAAPERFAPAEPDLALARAAALARASWVAALGSGREVLVVGETGADLLNMLSQQGARGVVAVTENETVAEIMRAEATTGVETVVADAGSLPFGDDRFGLVVWLDTETAPRLAPADVGELGRVVARDGILAIAVRSSDGAARDSLERILSRQFAHVALHRQHDVVASFVDGDTPPAAVPVDGAAEAETAVIAVASEAEIPSIAPVAVSGGAADVHAWSERFAEQQNALFRLHDLHAILGSRLREVHTLRRELQRSEAELARMAELRFELDAAGRDLAARSMDLEKAQTRLDQLAREHQELIWRAESAERVMAAMKQSPSWRLTAPLRAAKRVLRG